MTREKFFEESELESYSSFDELTRKCKELHEGCQKLTMQYEYEASIMNTGLSIDEDSLSYIQLILLNIVYYTLLK